MIQENFPHLARQANTQMQEIENSTKIFLKKSNSKAHNCQIHQGWNEEKILRAARKKGQVTQNGRPIRLTGDLSAETRQARRAWGPIFNILKEKNFQSRISYLVKLSFLSEGEIKSFTDKQLLRDFVTFTSRKTCLPRATEGSTKQGTTSPSHCKNIPNGKEQLLNEKTMSTNRQNNQPVTKC